jgi:hypothetical protein
MRLWEFGPRSWIVASRLNPRAFYSLISGSTSFAADELVPFGEFVIGLPQGIFPEALAILSRLPEKG